MKRNFMWDKLGYLICIVGGILAGLAIVRFGEVFDVWIN